MTAAEEERERVVVFGDVALVRRRNDLRVGSLESDGISLAAAAG